MMNKFDYLCENISTLDIDSYERCGQCDENGVSAWYHEKSYIDYMFNKCNNMIRDYKRKQIKFEVDGETYYEHWFFVNELHDSAVVGYSLMNVDGDVQFCVVGCKTDFVCDFDTMYQYLTNSAYFVD